MSNHIARMLPAVLALLFSAFLLTTVDAKPVRQILGDSWRSACTTNGKVSVTCCRDKSNDCAGECQSGDSCGAACTQCKNECSAAFSVCTAGRSIRNQTIIDIAPGGMKLRKVQ